MNEQTQQITRVRDAICQHVTAFLDAHLNQEFHCDTLRQYVSAQVGGYVAPGSADRILRMLRQKGSVNYTVVSRRHSLYKALPMAEDRLF